MIGNQLALIRRELWEHRSVYVVPLVIALVLTLLTLLGFVSAATFGSEVDFAIIGASHVGEAERRAILMGMLSMPTFLFSIAACILVSFYCLDALYAERKNKSILFWRSLPLTETETVVSKLLTAVLVIPVISFVVSCATSIVLLILTSVWIWIEGGSASHLVWSSVPLFDVWFATLIITLAMSLWLSPFVGWFLFVSAFTKRSPLLIASLGIILLPIVEKLVFRTHLFAEAIWERTFQPPLADLNVISMFEDMERSELSEDMVSMLSVLDIGHFLSSPSLWAGLVVCGLFVTAAIYMRRYRDDS